MSAKKKPKAKKLTVQQVKALKAGYLVCQKTKCNGTTCDLKKSADFCGANDDKSTVSIVSNPSANREHVS